MQIRPVRLIGVELDPNASQNDRQTQTGETHLDVPTPSEEHDNPVLTELVDAHPDESDLDDTSECVRSTSPGGWADRFHDLPRG